MPLSKISLTNFIYNIYNLFAYDYHKQDNIFKQQINDLIETLACEQIQHYFNGTNSIPYTDELQFIKENGWSIFPYKQLKTLEKVEKGFDPSKRLPFVIHDGKQLFFPRNVSFLEIEDIYRRYIETENLVGGGFSAKAPHQYQCDTFKVEEKDVFVDVGAAEGLVSLDVIEKASKVYLVESDSSWIPSLLATFAPYKDKCEIIKKLVSEKVTRKSTTLEEILKKELGNPLFIKMDIEGYETTALEASKDFLKNLTNVKIACCTYHRHHDDEIIARFFEEIGYSYKFSDGWMLFHQLENSPMQPPFFRHGLIRAWK